MIRSMCLFHHYSHVDGILTHYKSKIVSSDHIQQPRVEGDDTFILVVKLDTIHTILNV